LAASVKRCSAINPSTGQTLQPGYAGGDQAQVEQACALAWAAFDSYRETTPAQRAQLLETIAGEIEALGDALIERAMLETGLPQARLQGERARTCGQLRTFARTVLAGEWLDVRVDQAQPARQPLPRADLRQRQIPLGPVAVFGASNFPLAFSVAGDTASALAAGCPVIVKAHSAHPGTSELVGQAIARAGTVRPARRGICPAVWQWPRSGAGTGERCAHQGRGFYRLACRRAGLVPERTAACGADSVYAEMSSTNPVFLRPLPCSPVGMRWRRALSAR
jgi:NADP-dependent aldehyde dehydrogenase